MGFPKILMPALAVVFASCAKDDNAHLLQPAAHVEDTYISAYVEGQHWEVCNNGGVQEDMPTEIHTSLIKNFQVIAKTCSDTIYIENTHTNILESSFFLGLNEDSLYPGQVIPLKKLDMVGPWQAHESHAWWGPRGNLPYQYVSHDQSGDFKIYDVEKLPETHEIRISGDFNGTFVNRLDYHDTIHVSAQVQNFRFPDQYDL